jgi:hypothetical protein
VHKSPNSVYEQEAYVLAFSRKGCFVLYKMDSLRKYQIFETKKTPANRNNVPTRLIVKKAALFVGLAVAVLLFGWLIGR